MAMRFSVTPLKKNIFPYVSYLAGLKMDEFRVQHDLQYISFLEDAIKKNVALKATEILRFGTFKEARDMFSRMISQSATANITDEEIWEVNKKWVKQSIRMNMLATKVEELEDQFTKKFGETGIPQLWAVHYDHIQLAYEVTIVREIDEYRVMYEGLIRELPSLSISNASDASFDFLINRFFKLDEAVVRRVLDEWVGFQRDLHLAMEKFDFTLYLLDNKSDLVFKGDYEGLANVVRSSEEMLAKNHREEAVSELLKNWCLSRFYKPEKNMKSFKEEIQQEKEYQYKKRMTSWRFEAFRKKFFGSTKLRKVNVGELTKEVLNEDASPSAIPKGPKIMDNNVSP